MELSKNEKARMAGSMNKGIKRIHKKRYRQVRREIETEAERAQMSVIEAGLALGYGRAGLKKLFPEMKEDIKRNVQLKFPQPKAIKEFYKRVEMPAWKNEEFFGFMVEIGLIKNLEDAAHAFERLQRRSQK